jgi:Chaperone of endosialidase
MPRRLPSSSLDTQTVITAVSGSLSNPQATLSGYWKLDQKLKGDLEGEAKTAARLTADRTINGIIFNGTQNITVHTAGTGIGIGANGTDINNTGVTSITTSSGLSANTNATGAVSITNTGVTSITTSSGLSANTNATGAVSITNSGVTSAVSGTGVTVSAATGAVTFSIGQAVATDSDVRFGSIGVGAAAPGGNNVVVQGNVTAYSDRRLKDNIETITDALNKLTQVRGVTYTRTDMEDTLTRHTGVIAQELESVLPEAVMTDSDGIKSVAYGNVIGLLIESIKELNDKVDMLQQQLDNKNNG